MNPNLNQLHPYPFEKLTRLNQGITPPASLPLISLSIGEPKHPAPQFVLDALTRELAGAAVYPTTRGLPQLRSAIASWANNRFKLASAPLDPEANILPVTGTREALFAIVQALVDRTASPLVVCPNPFYQIYEGAALLAGAEPHYLACRDELDGQPDYDAVPGEIWDRCQVLFLCSPGNPNGAVASLAQLQKLIHLADAHDFVIAADECYSEIYPPAGTPPVGLLEACASLGRNDYKRCLAFHSLSKRSNLPGLRSGFVAGDAGLLSQFLRYRTYQGCAMPVHHQHASIAAWGDETHVQQNRAAYQAKFDAVVPILQEVLDVKAPQAGFYLWPRTPGSDEAFAQDLLQHCGVAVLPGRYLSRDIAGDNPGAGRVRMAMVAPLEECVEAAKRIRDFLRSQ
ncbi:MAG: succinyldiaminopimelate transaminase [Alteromonadaceae bacterium]|nr:succinyldiaminopimelate transaminase [Alteromonadaceae bacterium]|tara:strand:- start:4557 stop:5753 length:1197 start_codon:yes stop_codon:yes gene_type:complete